ncbi:MAG: hypothetical protein AAGH89_12095 [Verrucomicrobiota bacterium]
MNPDLTLLPNPEHALFIDPRTPNVFDRISEFRDVSVRAQNLGFILEKTACGDSAIPSADGDSLFFPELGLSFSLESCQAVHGTMRFEPEPMLRVEMDLADRMNALNFGVGCYSEESGKMRSLITDFASETISVDTLENWRTTAQQAVHMCPCCVQQSMWRAQYPKRHPIYQIFEVAVESKLPLHLRLRDENVDLTAELTPSFVHASKGWIRLGSPDVTLHTNLYYLHAMGIRNRHRDGEVIACLDIYSSHGRRMLEISADEAAASVWKDLCEGVS